MNEKEEVIKNIRIPNIPQGRVKLALVDGRLNQIGQAGIKKAGVEIIKTERYEGIYKAISCHPDIVFHHLGCEYILYAPGTSSNTLECLRKYGFKLICGDTELSNNYPHNVAYNVARVGTFAFHNFSYTDPLLKKELLKRDVELVNIKQGYAKCSISVIDEKSIITSDHAIAKTAEKKGIEVLFIEPEKGIMLKGLDYGFIGGSTGLLDKNLWALSGNIQKLNAKQTIVNFLAGKGIDILCLTHGNVVDIGSIVILSEEAQTAN